MFNHISSSSPYITVSSPVLPYVGDSGPLRWNGSSQQIEVMTQYGCAPVTLSGSTSNIQSSILDTVMVWALQKMQEESQLAKLLEDNPGLKEAKERYEIMLALIQKEN